MCIINNSTYVPRYERSRVCVCVCVCVCVYVRARVPMCMCVSFYYNIGLLSIHRFNKAMQFSVSAVCPVTKVTVYSVIVLLF